jgi:hypothetical protein
MMYGAGSHLCPQLWFAYFDNAGESLYYTRMTLHLLIPEVDNHPTDQAILHRSSCNHCQAYVSNITLSAESADPS